MKSTNNPFESISKESLLAILILLPILLVLFVYIPINIHPAEDAAILYSYSQNLADTGVISYNTNGEKAEGATDFLWMILISAYIRLVFRAILQPYY